MKLLGMQFRNLGKLGNSRSSIPLSRTPLEVMASLNTTTDEIIDQLDVALITGANYSGKTTLMLGLYFVLGGEGEMNDRRIPEAMVTNGADELILALEVQHTNEADFLNIAPSDNNKRSRRSLQRSYKKNTITIAIKAVRKVGHKFDCTYYVIDGYHDLALPFPPGMQVDEKQYRRLLERMGVNEGVLRVWKETMQQNQIGELSKRQDDELFDMVARIAGYDNLRKSLKKDMANMERGQEKMISARSALRERELRLEIAEGKRRLYEEWNQLNQQLTPAKEQEKRCQGVYLIVGNYYYKAQAQTSKKKQVDALGRLDTFRATLQTDRSRQTELVGKIKDLQSQLAKVNTEISEKARAEYAAEAQQARYRSALDQSSSEISEKTAEQWEAKVQTLEEEKTDLTLELRDAKKLVSEVDDRLRDLESESPERRLPRYVFEFSLALSNGGVKHTILANVLEIKADIEWQKAVEGYLGSRRLQVMVHPGNDFRIAETLVEQMKYRPGVVTPKRRPERPELNYRDTVWKILDLGEYLDSWGGHVDELGYQLMAPDIAAAQRIDDKQRTRYDSQNRAVQLRVFTKTQVITVKDVYVRSISSSDRLELYCGKRSAQSEIAELKSKLPALRASAMDIYQRCEAVQRQIDTCKRYAILVRQYQEALVELPRVDEEIANLRVAGSALVDRREELEEERIRLERESALIDRNLSEADTRLNQLQRELTNATTGLQDAEREAIKFDERYDELMQTLSPANRRAQIDREIHDVAEGIWLSAPSEHKDGQLKSVEKDFNMAADRVRDLDAQVSLLEKQNDGPISRELVAEYETAKKEFQNGQTSLQTAEMAYQKAMAAAKESYRLLKERMEGVVSVIRGQINEIGKILKMDVRVNLEMVDPANFDVTGNLDQIKMTFSLMVRFNDEKHFVKLNEPQLSGGQREMIAVSLMCGMLFAAQRLSFSDEERRQLGKNNGPAWRTAPPLMLDEPLKSLDPTNLRRAAGSILKMPVQIIVCDPNPPDEWCFAAHTIIEVHGGASSRRSGIEMKRVPGGGLRSLVSDQFLGRLPGRSG